MTKEFKEPKMTWYKTKSTFLITPSNRISSKWEAKGVKNLGRKLKQVELGVRSPRESITRRERIGTKRLGKKAKKIKIHEKKQHRPHSKIMNDDSLKWVKDV